MFPISLDLSRVRVALIGGGPAIARRLALLDEDGAREVDVYAIFPSPTLAAAAGSRLHRRLPEARDLSRTAVVFIADLDDGLDDRLAALARSLGALVNVEDRKALSDFHSPSVLLRGAVTIPVSTNGRAPGLARRLRRRLEGAIGPEWRDRVEELGARRTEWRRRGKSLGELSRLTDDYIDDRGWLS